MKKTPLLMAAVAACSLVLSGTALAQNPGGLDLQGMDPQELQNRIREFQNMNPQQRQAVLQRFQNMDPQQLMDTVQQRINSSLRERMAVTNDAEWSLIEVKITAVTKARLALLADGNAMMGRGGMRGGNDGSGNGAGGSGGGDRGLQAMFGQRSPEAQELQAAVDSDAPPAQIHSLLAKYRAARQEKRAALDKAEDELRKLLTIRQEAIATSTGLLD